MKRRSHDECGADRRELELLSRWEGGLEIPCSFLGKELALEVVVEAWALRVGPHGLVVSAVRGFVFLKRELERGARGSDNNAANTSGLAGAHGEESAVDSGSDEFVRIVRHEKG